MAPVQHKWNAIDYAKNSSAQLQWAQELLSKLALHGDESVLDVGCGDGKISAQIAAQVENGSVLGIDLSADMIHLASMQFNAEKFPNLSFMQMDATSIQLPRRFDAVFSNATLHWEKDHRAVLRGIHAALKPGGKILLQMGGRGNAADVFAVIKEIVMRPQWEPYYRDFTPPYYFYGPQEYRQWLQECGFQAIRIELVPKDMQHRGVDGLLGWLRTTWFPYTHRLPVELRDSFLSEVVEAYLAVHPIDLHGNSHVKMVRLEVEASTA
jgi:trans-aconitate 2-methyltransferase